MAMLSKTAVLDKVEGTFHIHEYEVPEPGDNEFILRVEYSGVCGTDVHVYYGHLNTVQYPIVLGHEFCGIIEKIGKNVKVDTNGKPVKVGDRVVIAPGVFCGECYYCKIAGTPTRCENSYSYGLMQNTENNLLNGAFSQYVHVKHPKTAFFKTDLDPIVAILTEPFSMAVYGFERAGGVRFGSTVLVQGVGAIGLGAIAFAKRSGAARVIAVGAPSKRLEIAKEFGADVTINIEDIKDPEERIKLVKQETIGGRGPDMVIECTGVPVSIPEGLAYLRDSGTYIEMGHFTDVGGVQLNPHWNFCRNNVTIHGIWGSLPHHLHQSLTILERMELPYNKIVTHRLPLSRCGDAMQALSRKSYRLDGEEQVLKIAIDPWAK